MTEKQHLKVLQILAHYESKGQFLKCVEELSELSEAIMKHINKGGGNTEAIFEEIADVEIMLDQIKTLLPYGYNVYEAEIDRKLDRQLRRIRGEGDDEEKRTCQYCYFDGFDELTYPCSRCDKNNKLRDMFKPTEKENK